MLLKNMYRISIPVQCEFVLIRSIHLQLAHFGLSNQTFLQQLKELVQSNFLRNTRYQLFCRTLLFFKVLHEGRQRYGACPQFDMSLIHNLSGAGCLVRASVDSGCRSLCRAEIIKFANKTHRPVFEIYFI